MVDPWLVVGNRITAKALHVTSHAECSRRYGDAKKDKWLVGTVRDVDEIIDPKSNRRKRQVICDFDLGGGTMKVKSLFLCSLKAYVAPQEEPVQPVLAVPV